MSDKLNGAGSLEQDVVQAINITAAVSIDLEALLEKVEDAIALNEATARDERAKVLDPELTDEPSLAQVIADNARLAAERLNTLLLG